jgi:1,4-alpha-glucan branching enzyme
MEETAVACKAKAKCKTSKAQKKSSPANKKKTIQSTEFSLHAPEAEQVYLVGDFNDWNPEQYSMRKFKTGLCTKKLKLAPGRYEYKFVVDGEWWIDPANDNRQITDMGENSIMEVSENVVVYK